MKMTRKLLLVVISEGRSKRLMNLQTRRKQMEASLRTDEINKQYRDEEAVMAKVKIISEVVVQAIMIIAKLSAMVVRPEVGEASVVVAIAEAETSRMVENNSHVEGAAVMAVNKHKVMKDGEAVKEVLEAPEEAKVEVAIEMIITEMSLIRTMPTRQRIP